MHPQTNGLVEAANAKILSAMKKKLECARGNWVDYLPDILWGIRTDKHSGTGETPFNLVYGTEAVIPAEMEVNTLRTESYDPDTNPEELRSNLDFLEERRLQAKLRQVNRSSAVTRYFNKQVKHRQFQVGDLVLRNCEASKQASEHKKLSPSWEGPYQVKQVLGKGAYKLQDLGGRDLPRTWNAVHLKKYFI